MVQRDFNQEIFDSLLRIQKEVEIAIEKYNAGLGTGSETAKDYDRLQHPLQMIKYHADKTYQTVRTNAAILYDCEAEQRRRVNNRGKVSNNGKP
jgi:hypothetical protein